MRIERIGAHEGELLRRLRVAALTDTPTAFGASLGETLDRPAEHWSARASDAARGDDQAFWFARSDGSDPVGLVGAFREHGDEVHLISMWVAPGARGAGLARRLVDEVVAWADAGGASAVTLHVESGNDRARRLYESAGFSATGAETPHESRPGLSVTAMRRDLAGARDGADVSRA